MDAKRLINFAAIACLAMAGLHLAACGTESSSGNDDNNGSVEYTTAVLNHFGFDFSENASGNETDGDLAIEVRDGDIIVWPPAPTTSTEDGLWFRTEVDNAKNYLKDMGEVALSSVTAIPASWDAEDGGDLPPLQLNHVYVVKCLDGYAKFLVTELTDPNGPIWEAQVKYYFTSSDQGFEK